MFLKDNLSKRLANQEMRRNYYFLDPYNIELINHELNCNSINVYGFNPFYKDDSNSFFYSSNVNGIEGLVDCMKKYVTDKENNKQI